MRTPLWDLVMRFGVRWNPLRPPSLLSDGLDEPAPADPFTARRPAALTSSALDSELNLLDMEEREVKEEEEEDGTGGSSSFFFFFLGFLMTPVLHLDFRGRL